MQRFPRQILLLGGLCASMAFAGPTAAQSVERAISNPRILGQGIEPESLTPPAVPRLSHERMLDLNIVYTDGQVFNPATGGYDKVRLRSYNGTDVDPSTPYVSPTIEARPGDTIGVNLTNMLPADPTCSTAHAHPNKPHCFNGTNLHTHGLWVNPAGNGDNVLLSINPGVTFQYEYKIRGDHPAGTFWYHTHRHGSTALQVSSGMAGALIVRGDRLPSAAAHGDLDTLLAGFPERTVVFQQIQYACREPGVDGALGAIKRNPNDTYRCDAGDVGEIESYDDFGPGDWGRSGRYTSLNGVVLPTFHTRQGQIERWRMIHAGVRDTISLRLVEMAPSAQLPATLSKADAQTFIQMSCTGPTVPYHLVAADGLTMAAAQRTALATFQPGYRFDAVMVFPKATQYCLIDASSTAAGSVNADVPGPELLGVVSVDPGEAVADISRYVTQALAAEAQARMPAEVSATIVADLNAGLKLTRFTPHPDIAEGEVTGTQELTFFIDLATAPPTFGVSNTASSADAQPYDPNRLDRQLALGSVDEWTLQSGLAGHPFHIHVNPFQIVSILDPNGREISEAGAVDDASPGAADPQYPGLKGMWKDTLWIKGPVAGGGRYTIKVRTRYQRYIGAFVLHCHILDHEDQGMMQNIAIVLPEGQIGAPVAAPAGREGHRHHP